MKEKFPGFSKCMKMMRSRDAATQEDGFHWLLPHTSEFATELIEELKDEEDPGLRYWLMELIAAAKSPEAFPFLSTQLRSNDWQSRQMAIIGLRNLDTKEARTLLWKARSFVLDTAEETEMLRQQLDSPRATPLRLWSD